MIPNRKNSSWIGASLERREDRRLLKGRGRFTDDVSLPRMGYVALLPSPYANARIKKIDLKAAQALSGVYLVVTGAQFVKTVGPMPTRSNAPVVQYCIAVDRVRHVGEPVAAVVAVNRYIAEDAVELIEVEYEEYDPVVDPMASIKATGNGVLHPDVGSNVVHKSEHSWGPLSQNLKKAAHIVTENFRWNRVAPQPIETCAAVADFNPAGEYFTIWSNMSQQSIIGGNLAISLGVQETQVNYHLCDVGGSFGGKAGLFHVPMIAAGLARLAKRPVKYVEDRMEHMANGNQNGSDRIYTASLSLDSDGRFTAVIFDVIDDFGAYFMINTGSHGNSLAQATGPYDIPALGYNLKCVLTNMVQQAPYRGFGGEVANFVLERLVDAAAKKMNWDPIDLRRRNFISKDNFPYRIPNGNIYDSGDYEKVLEKALMAADLPYWESKKKSAIQKGKRIGWGISTVNERSVLSMTEFWFLDKSPRFPQTSSPESVQIRIASNGRAVVTIYAPHWGNSPETMAVQLVAETLGMHPDHIEVNYGSTENGMISKGPVGSRYTVMLAGAIAGACKKLKDRIFTFAAHMLEVEKNELVIRDEVVSSAFSGGKSLTFAEISRYAHNFRLEFPAGEEYASGLIAQYTYDHPLTTSPNPDTNDLGIFYPIVGHACHIAIVEVDEITLQTKFLKYVAVHDAGTIVNPKAVAGQIRGGIAQGIGTALYERVYYDDQGQLLTVTLADYAIPTSLEIPDIVIDHVETPSPYTEYGIKGCGEGGRLAAMPAIAAAIDNAFKDKGLFIRELPVTPSFLYDNLHIDD